MNLLLLKQIGLFSVLIGLALGVIAAIPVIGVIYILAFIMLSAAIIVYLKKNSILGEISVKEGGIIGSVIGFTFAIASACTYIPISIIVHFITHNFWGGQIIIACFSSVAAFITLLFLIVFFALLCALMNGFSGAVTIYIYEVLAKIKHDEENFQNYYDK